MTIDNMTPYSAIAASYKSLPLIALRELESVLQHEIKERECGFGMHKSSPENDGEGQEAVGDVSEAKRAGVGESCTNKGVINLKLTLVQGGLK